MRQTVYKTQPRLFVTSITFIGFAFFGLLSLLILQGIRGNYSYAAITMLVFFGGASLFFLFHFMTIKTIKLTKENVIISHLFLPIRKTINLSSIRNMEQMKKEIDASIGSALTSSYIYTDITTSIILRDNTRIKLNSIGQIDFDKFYKTFKIVKQGEGKIKEEKLNFYLYLIDNIDGTFWIMLSFLITAGLGCSIIAKQWQT